MRTKQLVAKAGLSVAVVSAALGMSFGVAGTASADPAPAAPKPQFFNNSGGCGSMQVIAAPGTTETNVNMPENQAAGFMGAWGKQVQKYNPSAQVRITPYPAQVGGPVAGMVTGSQQTMYQSKGIGVKNMARQVQAAARACPNTPIVLAGYSQGADVAGTVCSGIGRGKIPGVSAGQIKSCELFGDPMRGTDDASMTDFQAAGAGILGNGRDYGELNGKIRQACLEGDPICAYRNRNVAEGLGPGSKNGTALPSSNFMNIKMPWKGSNGFPQQLADALGGWAAFNQVHTAYGAGNAGVGGGTTLDNSARFITGNGGGTKPQGAALPGANSGGGAPAGLPNLGGLVSGLGGQSTTPGK